MFVSIFIGIEINALTAHSLISTIISNLSKPPRQPRSPQSETNLKRRKESKRYKTKIGVRTSVTVKVVDINEKIREGKIRSMMKDLVGCI